MTIFISIDILLLIPRLLVNKLTSSIFVVMFNQNKNTFEPFK